MQAVPPKRPKTERDPIASSPAAGGRITFRELPFSKVDADALRQSIAADAADKAAAFPRLVDELKELLRSCYPPHVIAVLAGWGLLASIGRHGVSSGSMIKGIEQHHVELLQALVLTMPVREWGKEPAAPRVMQSIIDALKALALAFSRRRLVEREQDEQSHMVALLQERVRGHTQHVRNWGYTADVVRISKEVHAPLDAAIERHHGFSATDLIVVARALIDLLGERLNERFKLLRSIWAAETIPDLVRRYFEHYPGVEGDPEDFLRGIPPEVTREQVRYRLLAHADIWLLTYFSFDASAVAERAKLDERKVSLIMRRLSFQPGALEHAEAEHLFLGNPVWMRPGIVTADGYFVAIPQTILSFVTPVLRELCHEAGLAQRLEKRRAKYLEIEMQRCLASALPGARVQSGVKWSWENNPYETDALITLDRTLVIAEAKSASLTPRGLRGAPDRVRRHVNDLVLGASEQSARLRDIIERAKSGDEPAQDVTSTLGIDPQHIDTIIRVSVTFDDFSMITSAENELKRAGWVAKDLDLAPTLNIADLGVVIELLERPALVLHYLSERSRLQKVAPIFGDELDFLGTYLATGFHMPEIEDGTHKVTISGMSAEVDNYVMSREAGVLLPKPLPSLTLYIASVLDRLQERRRPGWTTISLGLLNAVSHDVQEELEQELSRLKRTVPRQKDDPRHENSLIVVPSGRRDIAAIFHVYPAEHTETLVSRLRSIAGDVCETYGKRQVVMIARMIEEWEQPYRFAGIASF